MKFKLRIATISILLLFLLSTTCNDEEYGFKGGDIFIENQSDEPIYVVWRDKEMTLESVLYGIEDNSICRYIVYPGRRIPNGEWGIGMPSGQLYIIVFKLSTLNRYTKEQIVKEDIKDGYYSLTMSDVAKLENNTLIYTGK